MFVPLTVCESKPEFILHENTQLKNVAPTARVHLPFI